MINSSPTACLDARINALRRVDIIDSRYFLCSFRRPLPVNHIAGNARPAFLPSNVAAIRAVVNIRNGDLLHD